MSKRKRPEVWKGGEDCLSRGEKKEPQEQDNGMNRARARETESKGAGRKFTEEEIREGGVTEKLG